jgi:hypothetical protein
MFCKKCGAQLPEGSTFCPMCGTNNAENAGEEQAATGGNVPKFGKKKLGIILAAVVVVVVLVIAVAGGSSSGSTLKVDKNAVSYVQNGYFMTSDGESKEFDDVYNTYVSMDGSAVLYVDYDSDLYIVDKKLNAEKIASDVTTVRVGREGEYVAYLCNEDNDIYSQTLYIYNVSKDKSEKIDEDVVGGDYLLTISASGKSVVYVKGYEDEDSFDTYVAGYSKKATKIESKGYYPVAVSDDGKRAYLRSDESTLYFYKNGKQSGEKIKKVASPFYTNSDLSELVFSKDGDTYFCRPGKEAEKIGNSTISYVVYPGSYGTTTYLGGNTQVLGNDTIKGQVVYTDSGKLMWVNKKATDMVKIDGDVGSVHISDDCSSVAYVSNNKVYKVSKFKESMEPTLLYDDEKISSIATSGDLKKIYAFSSDDDTVYYLKGNNKAEKISEDVDDFAYNETDGKLYYLNDEEIYSAKTSSSSKKKVSGVDGDAYYLDAKSNGIIAYTNDGGDYLCYYIGKKAVQVYEE